MRTILLIVLSFAAAAADLSGQAATIKEESRSVLTYPYSDPNPVPVLAISNMVSPFYPYFVWDGYTTAGVDKSWKVVSLDNDYISVTVLPEVGGKVWGAIEKSTGREFVYMNHVMKFRAIGIRGPWTSGGIEHNFGLDLGHAPWTSSPVDYVISRNDDGSVSCTVGGLDLASRTEWRVNILLPPGKSYFETRSTWYNPTPFHDAYLSWENGGFSASGNLQFFFPGYYYIGHDGSANPWPVDKEGRDLSWYDRNNFGTSKSYHVSGYYTDWFGGYWHDHNFGFGHSAPYSDAPGKKIWIWSLARDGAIWEELLTDSDGQYIEAQSGVKFNQANRESGYHSPFNQLSMRPYYTDTKREYWFPVAAAGGMKDASQYGTLNVETLHDSIRILISPNVILNDTLHVSNGNRELLSAAIALQPMRLFTVTVPLRGIPPGNITVSLGRNLLSWNSDEKQLTTGRPLVTGPDLNPGSPEHLYSLAEDMSAMRDYNGALEYYNQCISIEPYHSKALTRLAELSCRMTDYEEAMRYARRILSINTYDGGANFMAGIIHRRTGDTDQAEEALSVAARTMEYRSAAFAEIAGIRMQRKDFDGAAEYAMRSLDFNRLNIQAMKILCAAFRKLGKTDEAQEVTGEILRTDPLCHFARFEQYLGNPGDRTLSGFKSLIRNELPHETYLELAVTYYNLGMEPEALQVLRQSPPNPMVSYWLAFLLRNSPGEESSSLLREADESSPYLVFPSRTESIPVLEWAQGKTESWKSKYYLSLIYWHINRKDKAAGLMELCGDMPDYAPFYIARGTLFLNIQSEYCHPCSDFTRAVDLAPGEWRTWHYLINFQQGNAAFSEELQNAQRAYSMFPKNPVIGTDYAKALLNSRRYQECLKILEKVKILPQEGAHEGHDIWEIANLGIAAGLMEKGKYRAALIYVDQSRTWPENLGAGKPYDPDNRFQDLLAAECYKRLGQDELAEESREAIIRYGTTAGLQEQDPVNLYISIKLMKESGRADSAGKLMDRWKNVQDSVFIWKISAGSSSPRARWLSAIHEGNEDEAENIAKEISSDPAENRFRLMIKTFNNLIQ